MLAVPIQRTNQYLERGPTTDRSRGADAMIAFRPTRPRFALPDWLRSLDFEPLQVLPLLTIVLLLTATPDQWYLRGPLIALFALGVVYQSWLQAPQFWYVVATLLGATVYLNWESSDNHK